MPFQIRLYSEIFLWRFRIFRPILASQSVCSCPDLPRKLLYLILYYICRLLRVMEVSFVQTLRNTQDYLGHDARWVQPEISSVSALG